MITKVLLFLCSITLLEALEYNSNISVEKLNHSTLTNELIVYGDTKLKLENDIFSTNATVEYLYSFEYKKRRYIKLNELYITKDFEDYSLSLGKVIKYWGELEGYNIADVYNQKNLTFDPFDKDAKLGSVGFDIKRYYDHSSLEFGVKDEDHDKPSFYFVYNFTTDEFVESENRFIIIDGYDDKFMFLSNLLYDDFIFKCETSYTVVASEKKVSDFLQLSFGVEKSFYDVLSSDITLYLEYYNYHYMQDYKLKNTDISTLYDNDIFLAFKLNLNDVQDSELKSGVFYDAKTSQKMYKVEFKSRIVDNLVLNAEFLKYLQDYDRFSLGFTYSF